MIYKSSVDFPSETEAIDESCFNFIGDVSIGSFAYCTCILQEVGLRVENENGLAGFAADRRAPYA